MVCPVLPWTRPFISRTMAAAEFDASALAAVSSFFGEAKQTPPSSQHKEELKKKSTPSLRKRGGVGLSTTSRQNDVDVVQKRLMQVGKRKRHEDDSDGENDDSGEEDEEGRTAIRDRKQKKEQPVPEKKQKKKGKKERQRAKEDTEPAPPTDIEVSNSIDETKPKKKHRKKVRSRQKNIYKDTRRMHEKPEHLRKIGSHHYRGRPMTPATRAKLKLPTKISNNNNNNSDFEELVLSTEATGKLAVDDLLLDNGTAVNTTIRKVVKKRKKTNKKPRYKNLA